MSDEKEYKFPKITMQKREFLLENGQKYTLEYPSNYNELVNRKLDKLQKEYDECHNEEIAKCAAENIDFTNVGENKSEEDEKKENYINKESAEIENKGKSDENNENMYEKLKEEDNDENYYEQINNDDKTMNKNYNIELTLTEENIKENINNTENNTKEFNIDYNESNCENKNKHHEIKSSIKTEENNDETEFVEVKEEGIESKENNEEFEFVEENKTVLKSKVKNPEKIKEAMKKLNLKAPEWAKNLNDNDFVMRAKNFLRFKGKNNK